METLKTIIDLLTGITSIIFFSILTLYTLQLRGPVKVIRKFSDKLGEIIPQVTGLIEDDISTEGVTWDLENRELGRDLGYPECCIDEFCNQTPSKLKLTDRTPEDQERYEAGCIDGKFTGFVPCIRHARIILRKEKKLEDLIIGRNPEFPPFPKFGRNDTDIV